jgi:MFS family permease
MKQLIFSTFHIFWISVASANKISSNSHVQNVNSRIKRTNMKLLHEEVQDHRSYIASHDRIDMNQVQVTKPSHLKFLSMFLPWLYFLCSSMNIPSMPGYINSIINHGNRNPTSKSAQVYGYLQGFDAFFTFLSVNFIGCLSDVFGRKPFMFLSSFGIGLAYFLHFIATKPENFYLAGSIDGLTSCMLSQAQAYVSDIAQHDSTGVGVALSQFQGLAIGMAFLVGIPIGGILSAKFAVNTPLQLSVLICILNCLLIFFCLPNNPYLTSSSPQTVSLRAKLQQVQWWQANPLGASLMLTRTWKLIAASIAYFCINLAQAGVQSTWINYLGYRFGMSQQESGSTLLILGIMIASFPPLIVYVVSCYMLYKPHNDDYYYLSYIVHCWEYQILFVSV